MIEAEAGNLTIFHGSLFQCAQKLFKEGYRLSSKTARSVMQETRKECYRVVLDNLLETKQKVHRGENIV